MTDDQVNPLAESPDVRIFCILPTAMPLCWRVCRMRP